MQLVSILHVSLIMCLKSDYDKWANGELLLYTGWGYGYPKDHQPKENHFYTKEQVIEFEKTSTNSLLVVVFFCVDSFLLLL